MPCWQISTRSHRQIWTSSTCVSSLLDSLLCLQATHTHTDSHSHTHTHSTCVDQQMICVWTMKLLQPSPQRPRPWRTVGFLWWERNRKKSTDLCCRWVCMTLWVCVCARACLPSGWIVDVQGKMNSCKRNKKGHFFLCLFFSLIRTWIISSEKIAFPGSDCSGTLEHPWSYVCEMGNKRTVSHSPWLQICNGSLGGSVGHSCEEHKGLSECTYRAYRI